MWTVFLGHQNELEYFKKNLKNSHELIETAIGTQVLKCKEKTGFHFLVAPPPETSLKPLLAWVIHNLMPSAFVSSSLSPPMKAPAGSAYFIPKLCFRAAGRTEIGGGPLLFEEIALDEKLSAALQKEIPEGAQAENGNLFSMRRIVEDIEEREWVLFHLGCKAFDHYSGELLINAKRLGIPVAALKRMEISGKDSLAELFTYWRKFPTVPARF